MRAWCWAVCLCFAATGCSCDGRQSAPRGDASMDPGDGDGAGGSDGSGGDGSGGDGGGGDGGGGQLAVDAGPDAGDGAMPDAGPEPHPESEYCGDAIRDPVTEECDDGVGDGALCTDDCRVRAGGLLAALDVDADAGVADVPDRLRGTGPHSASAGDAGFAVAYVEDGARTDVLLQRFDEGGVRLGSPLAVAAGRRPTAGANPVVAALPDGAYAVAFTDALGGTPDIALLRVEADGTVGTPRLAHVGSAGPQQDPDLLWAGDDLIVGWTDLVDVRARRFDASLSPRNAGEVLAATAALESSVTLAPLSGKGRSWAAAWRSVDGGLERIEVRAGGVAWHTGAAPPAPAGERPALLELDEGHLLLCWVVSTDPLATGTANTPRLRLALLARDAPGAVTGMPLVGDAAPYADDDTLGQRHPTLAQVGARLLVAWEQESPLGDARGDELLVYDLAWSPDTPDEIVRAGAVALAPDAPTAGDQRNPLLSPTPMFPGGALLLLWEDHTGVLPGRPARDLLMALRPVPFVTLPLPARGSGEAW